jgi:hypothetical protein
MKINEILVEGVKPGCEKHAEKFKAMEVGKPADPKTVAFLKRLEEKYRKHFVKEVMADPDQYGVDDDGDMSRSEMREGINVHTHTVDVFENGFWFHLMVDTDDIGGSSDNHEDLTLDVKGNIAPHGFNLADGICTFSPQENEHYIVEKYN